MPGWLLTIKVHRDGTELDFIMRETMGNVVSLDVERAILRSDRALVERLVGGLRMEVNERRPTQLHGILEELGEAIARRLMPQEVVQLLADSSHDHPLLTIETNDMSIPWVLARIDGEHLLKRFGVACQGLRSTPPPRLEGADSPVRVQALVVGDPELNLPWVAEEIDRLKSVLGGHATIDILHGAQATSSRLLDALECGTYGIIHFSCHSTFDEQHPSRSLIHLHDEPVPASRLFDVRYRLRPLLVFLNGCQGGRTDGHQAGFADIFLRIGARAFVGPSWPVDDAVSTRLSSLFYQNLANGRSVGEALRRARLACADNPDDYLVSWASYLAFGNPGTEIPSVAALETPPTLVVPKTTRHPYP